LGSGVQVSTVGVLADIGAAAGPQFIWNGSGYVGAWPEGGAGLITFISKDGVATGHGVVTASGARDLSIAYRSGVEYGVTWGDFGGSQSTWAINFGRADLSGNLVNGSKVQLSTPGALPTQSGVAWTGSDWLAVWAELPTPQATKQQIWMARIATTGAIEAGTRRRLTCADANDAFPKLVWGGGQAGVTFNRNDSEGRILIFK
jgi:hypothetical protein